MSDDFCFACGREFSDSEPGRWIPVSKRLPEISDGNYAGLILVFWDEWKMTVVTVSRMLELQADGSWNITYWMPLPEPPEGVDRV